MITSCKLNHRAFVTTFREICQDKLEYIYKQGNDESQRGYPTYSHQSFNCLALLIGRNRESKWLLPIKLGKGNMNW